MIGKVIGGKSFAGTVGYVMKQDAKVLDSEGVNPPEVKDMVQDFSDQALLNPRVKNTVGHISLSFSELDKDKLSDKTMVEIAREYMLKMGIADTQYLIVRHHDAPHPHCHIVYNRVKNDGTTVPDSNIRLRNVAVCRELTEKHGLYFASGKEQVREHRLREPDKTKYEIYNAIRTAIPDCRTWSDLEHKLSRHGIGLEFKTKGNTGIREGVKFSKNGYTFSGSKGSGNDAINLSDFGGGSLPLPPTDLGIGISAAQLQRQPNETPEQHIARITALIHSVTAAMLAHTEEQKRKQRQKQEVKRPKLKM